MNIQRTSLAKTYKRLEKKVGPERASNFIHAKTLDPIEHETIHQVLDRRLGSRREGREATNAWDRVRVDIVGRGVRTEIPNPRIVKHYSYFDERANQSHDEKVRQGLRRTGFGEDFIDNTQNRLLSEPYAVNVNLRRPQKRVQRTGAGENRELSPEERKRRYQENRKAVETQIDQFKKLQAIEMEKQRHTERKTGRGEDMRLRRRSHQIGDNLLELAGGLNW